MISLWGVPLDTHIPTPTPGRSKSEHCYNCGEMFFGDIVTQVYPRAHTDTSQRVYGAHLELACTDDLRLLRFRALPRLRQRPGEGN